MFENNQTINQSIDQSINQSNMSSLSVIANTCMACTIAYNISDVDVNSIGFNDTNKYNIQYDEYPTKQIYIDFIYYENKKNKNDKKVDLYLGDYKKSSQKDKYKNKNIKNKSNIVFRKKHNIKQPGRTNCNQRLCLK